MNTILLMLHRCTSTHWDPQILSQVHTPKFGSWNCTVLLKFPTVVVLDTHTTLSVLHAYAYGAGKSHYIEALEWTALDLD